MNKLQRNVNYKHMLKMITRYNSTGFCSALNSNISLYDLDELMLFKPYEYEMDLDKSLGYYTGYWYKTDLEGINYRIFILQLCIEMTKST